MKHLILPKNDLVCEKFINKSFLVIGLEWKYKVRLEHTEALKILLLLHNTPGLEDKIPSFPTSPLPPPRLTKGGGTMFPVMSWRLSFMSCQ